MIQYSLFRAEEKGAIVAGMFGYKFHAGIRPALEPMHGWTLLLEPTSIFRKDLTNWEQNVISDSGYENYDSEYYDY